ncbi:ribonuclease H-like domain-containing protein [Patescibacteria group bacterium]
MKQIILDVETIRTFDEVGGYKPEKLGVSFVGAIERDGFDGKGKELEFFENDLSKLWIILESADVVVGFNTDGFDLPVLQPYYPGKITDLPSLDLMARIKDSVGHRISLDAVAMKTLGTQKSGNGLDAITYYQNGELDKLAQYCLKDVAITRDIYDYGREKGVVKFLNRWNELVEAPVDFSFEKKNDGTQMTLGGL